MAVHDPEGGASPPVTTAEPVASPPRTAPARAKAGVPVARPAPSRPRVSLASVPESADDLDRKTLVYGMAISVAFHALLMLVLAFWYFNPLGEQPRTLDTSLAAGSPFGDELGDQLKGGLGMDEPLALADPVPDGAMTPVFTSLAASDLKLDAPATKNAAAPADASGGGVALTGTGQAGAGDGFGVARFGQGGERINGVDVKVGDPQFTLIWDSKADIDLHVLEPKGSEIFWESPRGDQGGELDVDDMDGFGPENVNYGAGKMQGPAGTYKWFVHYYGAKDGISTPTKWKVRVKHDGTVTVFNGKFQRIGEKSKVFTLSLDRPESKGDAPADATP